MKFKGDANRDTHFQKTATQFVRLPDKHEFHEFLQKQTVIFQHEKHDFKKAWKIASDAFSNTPNTPLNHSRSPLTTACVLTMWLLI